MSIYEFIKNKYNAVCYPLIDERQFDDVVNEIRAESAERIKELEAEKKKLMADLEHSRSYKRRIKMRSRNLQVENEKLKAENIMLRSAGLKQTLEHEQIFKDFIKENAKLKCLVLHALRDLFDYKGHKLEFEGNKIWVKYCHKYNEFDKAYRKAKAEMMEKK